MSDIKILNSASNAVVAKLSDREFPGVLIQGDTLRIFLDDIDELKEELDEKNLEDAKDIAEDLRMRFTELLNHYEKVLAENGLSLPYVNPVNK